MEQFLNTYGRLLGTKNYNIIELTLGKSILPNIFSKKIEKEMFHYLISCFNKQKQNEEIKVNVLENKIYFQNNLELFINPNFQQRVYQTILKDNKTIQYNDRFDINIKFQERKMISIENFPIKKQYHNEIFQKMTSFNIKNKFYVNFIENLDESNKKYYCIKILIKRKTNNRFHDLTKFIEEYINLISKFIDIKNTV